MASMTGDTISGINSSYIEVLVPLGGGTTVNNIDTTNNQDGDIISITKHSSTPPLLIQSNNIGSGNIYLSEDSCTLSNNVDILTVILVGTQWRELTRSNRSSALSNQLQTYVWGGKFNTFSSTTACTLCESREIFFDVLEY